MFEIKTFAFTLLPLLVASLIVLLVNWRIHRKMRGPAYWAGGAAARLLGIMLIAMSGALPEILTNVVGYLLVVFGDFLSVKGLSLFGNRPWYKRTTYVTLLLLVVGFCYYTYVQPEPYHRVMVLVAGHVVSIFLVALLLLHIVRQEGLGGVLILGLSSFWEVFLGPFLLLMMYMASGDVDIEVAIGWVQPMSATAMIGILQTFGFTLLTASRTQRELRDMALLDTLTGIPNRRAFDSAMKRAVEATKRSGTRLGLAVIDIDFFKRVNDNYGHAVGDALLRHVHDLARQRFLRAHRRRGVRPGGRGHQRRGTERSRRALQAGGGNTADATRQRYTPGLHPVGRSCAFGTGPDRCHSALCLSRRGALSRQGKRPQSCRDGWAILSPGARGRGLGVERPAPSSGRRPPRQTRKSASRSGRLRQRPGCWLPCCRPVPRYAS